jgi:hypothetical protein
MDYQGTRVRVSKKEFAAASNNEAARDSFFARTTAYASGSAKRLENTPSGLIKQAQKLTNLYIHGLL